MATNREQEMRALLAEQESSGQSVRDFAEQRGLKKASLYWWRSELRRRNRDASPRHDFIEVDRVPYDESDLEILVTDDDARILVGHDFDEQLLIRLVAALRRC